MSEAAKDPYAVLGVAHDVSDIELRRVYRTLVKRHHPDHNGGSAQAAERFAQIQNAYDQIAHHRAPPKQAAPQAGPAEQRRRPSAGASRPTGSGRQSQSAREPGIEDRIATLEREMAALREAEQRRMQEQVRLAREQARRPTPEELGYYTTDDSFTKIIDDAAEQFSDRLRKSDAKKQFARRLSDLFGRDV